MKKITLKKIEIVDLEVIQTELLNFITVKSSGLHLLGTSNAYFSDLLILDIAQNLYYTFRNKIERTTKTIATFSVSAAEAVILTQVCTSDAVLRNPYETYCMNKLASQLFEELVNLSKPVTSNF